MANSVKSDLQLLKELQDIDSEIILQTKNIDNARKTIAFLKEKTVCCDDIIEEINKANVLNKITVENIKTIVEKYNLVFEDYLEINYSVEECIGKINDLRSIFSNKAKEKELSFQAYEEEINKIIESLSSKKKGIYSILKPEFSTLYDRLFSLFDDHIVLAKIENNTCSHCHVETCLQKNIDVLKFTNVVFCEHCGRILVD